ncbi:methyl-accepting chemotaxis protein [Plasticicumulans lactativorans]|uniref:Methyl-accepting chemotaxis protein n=1 Tax=Plasticicumulans lactativorans TaxID=1133106 RepID=A0A4R2LQS3_9GAMM|nr:methyl-accepting chemotaxis protein [Plasticicumulans lactativorans]TCO81931.1 methyl-accepting chemotaxis protein [Plasticicumulans lactativorans]
MLRQTRIGTRLACGFAAVLALLVLMTGFALIELDKMEGIIGHVVEGNVKKMQLNGSMRNAVNLMEVEVRHATQLAYQGDVDEVRKRQESIEAQRAAYDQAWQALVQMPTGSQGAQLRLRIDAARAKARAPTDRLIELALLGKMDSSLEVLNERLTPALYEWRDALGENMRLQDVNNREDYAAATSDYHTTLVILLALAGVSVALGAALAWAVTRSITQPLAQVAGVLEAVEQGDLTREAEVAGRDELTQVAERLNLAIGAQRRSLDAIENANREVQAAAAARAESERREAAAQRAQMEAERAEAEAGRRRAEELQHKVDTLLEVVEAASRGDLTRSIAVDGDDAIGQIARGLGRFFEDLRGSLREIGATAGTLAAASEEMGAVSTQLTAAAGHTADDARQVSASAGQANARVEAVAAATEEMSASIREIARSTAEASSVSEEAVRLAEHATAMVSRLGESSQRIGEVVKLISSIAEQTNLLALNATIEAARAGEAGKGFAVVAGEVKELAKGTAQATDEIGQRVSGIQDDTQGAVAAIDRIFEIIRRISDIQTSIAGAVEEQNAVSNDIAGNLGHTVSATGEIAHGVDRVAQTATGTLHGSSDVRQAATQLAEMAAQLQQLVNRFRV